MRTPEDDVSRGNIQSWNVAVERRLPLDLSVDLAYVGSKGTDGFADLDINASDTPGGGNAEPSLLLEGPRDAISSWGPRLETQYHSLQTAINRPFKNGLLLKGAYTWSKADEHGRRRRLGGPDVERREPVPTATSRWPATTARTSSRWASSTSCRSARTSSGAAELRDQGLAGQRHLRRLLRCAVHGHGRRRRVNMPGNTQTANQVGDYTVTGDIGNEGAWFDTTAFRQPQGVVLGNTGRNAFRGPGQWRVDFSVFRGFNVGGNRKLEFRMEAFNLTNSIQYGDGTTGNPWGFSSRDVNNPNFGKSLRRQRRTEHPAGVAVLVLTLASPTVRSGRAGCSRAVQLIVTRSEHPRWREHAGQPTRPLRRRSSACQNPDPNLGQPNAPALVGALDGRSRAARKRHALADLRDANRSDVPAGQSTRTVTGPRHSPGQTATSGPARSDSCRRCARGGSAAARPARSTCTSAPSPGGWRRRCRAAPAAMRRGCRRGCAATAPARCWW